MSFGEAGVLDFAPVDGCLLVHQTVPPRTIRIPSAVSNPVNFIPRYLRFHQTETPEKITISGRNMTLVRKRIRSAEPQTRSRRSSGSFGRIEMRSSSDV